MGSALHGRSARVTTRLFSLCPILRDRLYSPLPLKQHRCCCVSLIHSFTSAELNHEIFFRLSTFFSIRLHHLSTLPRPICRLANQSAHSSAATAQLLRHPDRAARKPLKLQLSALRRPHRKMRRKKPHAWLTVSMSGWASPATNQGGKGSDG